MKKLFFSTLLSFSFCITLVAQVANDNCSTAQVITIPASGNICINSTTLNALGVTYSSHPCWPINQNIPEVWFTFIATGSSNTVSVSPTGTPAASQLGVTLNSGGCASTILNTCALSTTNGGTATATWTYPAGTQVWVNVGSMVAQGGFQLCITSVTAPPAPGNSCATATTLCSKNNFSVSTFPNNTNAYTPSCFPTALQRPIFYQFTVGVSGTMIWTATPMGSATEYDWVVYDITGGCPGTVVCCNFNYASSSGAPIGMSATAPNNCGTSAGGGAPGEFSPPANVTVGNTYMLVIDNWSGNNVGFNFTWGGTMQIAPIAQFTATPPTSCGPANVTFNNTSIASIDWDWNFGDGTTLNNTLNPPVHNYSTPGTYLISLVTTSATGCTDVTSQSIIIKPKPTVTVNSQTVCNGSPATLTASPSLTGGIFSWAPGGATTPSITVSPATTTTYTVTYTLNGCSGTGTGTVTVNPIPTVTSNSQTICTGGTATLTATPSTGGGSYSWATGGQTTSSITVTPASTTTFTVTYTLTGCANTGTGTVTVNPTPTVTVPANSSVCAGTSIPASAFTSNVAGATFAWTNSNAAIGLAASGAGNTPAFTATNATASPITSTITVTPTANGCSGSPVTYTITVNPMPVVTVNSPSICPGGTATLTAAGAASYSWSNGAVTNPITVSPGATTSYTVTGTSATCTSTAVSTVTVGGSMSITVNSPTICAGQTANLVASGATTYTWSAGATPTGTGTANATPAATTSYTVTGTTGACSGTGVSTVTITTVPTVIVTSPTVCNGTTATMTASGATTYTWSAGATATGTTTATATPATTTSYTVTGANGTCTNTAVSTVTVNAIPTVTVNSPTICSGTTANLIAGGATTYTWSAGATSTGANTANASPASTTSYTVTGTTSGCTNTAVSTVTVAPSLNVTVNSPTICAGQTANLTAGGATSYAWTAGATSTGTTTADATPAATTSYTVTGTTGTCTGTAVSTVTVTPLPTVTATSATVCNGTTANLTAGGATSYVWSTGATSTGVNTADATPSTTTSYTVTGTTSGCSATAVSTVTVNPIPNVTVNSPSVCPGSTAMLTANGATSYTWSAGATSTGVNTATATPASTNTYTVTGTSLGCSATAVSTVTVNTVLSVNAGADDTICYGQSANLTVTPNGAGYSYAWTPSASLSNATVYNPTATPASTTNYSVTVTDPNGCTGTGSVTIYADPQIDLSSIVGLPPSCNGGNGQVIVIPSGGSGPYSYSWTGGCTTAACTELAGSYTVTVTDTWGCTATNSASFVNPPALSASETHVNATCFAACNGSATANATGGTPNAGGTYNYSWSTSPVQNTQTATGLCAGTYTCVVSDANGCSPPNASVVVTITEPAAVAIAPMPAITICNSGSTPVNTNVTGGTGAYSYSWSPATGLSSATAANPTASPATTTTYTLTVTDANSCTDVDSVTIIVNPPLSVIAAGTNSVCPGFSTPVTATASNGAGSGYTYSWSPAAGLDNPSSASAIASPAASTTYTVTANDGCSPAVTATVTVTVLPLPVPIITSNIQAGCSPVCSNFASASTISSGSITGWSWNFGDAANTAPGLGQVPTHCYTTPGTYTVTLTDTSAAGCIATSTIPFVITVYPNPVAAFTAPASTSIFTPTVQYTDESTISSGAIVGWDWNFGDNLATPLMDSSLLQNPSHLFSEVGTYCAELIVTSDHGCQDMSNMCIVIDPEFTFFIPNAFSPNDDGINDEFYGKGENIKKYEMNIFDRWGNLIFHADDINKHWDGRANNGSEVAQEDVYVYSVKLTDIHDRLHKYLGTVTIVK